MPTFHARLGMAALLLAVLSAPTPAACLRAVRQPSEVPAPDVLVAVLGLLAHALAVWLLVVAALVLGSHAPAQAGRACAWLLRGCAPAHLRQAVAAALGAGLVLVLPTAGAAASDSGSARAASTASFDWPGLTASVPERHAPVHPVPDRPVPQGPALDPAPERPVTAERPLTGEHPPTGEHRRTTERPVGPEHPVGTEHPVPEPPVLEPPRLARGGPGARPARVRDTVVVRSGDTLWELAGRSLPVPAADADRAAEWPRWWAANRNAIGDDPDLLLPGQRLVAPPAR